MRAHIYQAGLLGTGVGISRLLVLKTKSAMVGNGGGSQLVHSSSHRLELFNSSLILVSHNKALALWLVANSLTYVSLLIKIRGILMARCTHAILAAAPHEGVRKSIK